MFQQIQKSGEIYFNSQNILTDFYGLHIITHRYLSMGGELDIAEEREVAAIFKAFCDENRIRIIKLLRTGEKCACELLEEINVTQPTLSHHMKILCDAGIVVGRKEGKWTYYSISEKGVERAKECLQQLTTLDSGCENKSCCEK